MTGTSTTGKLRQTGHQTNRPTPALRAWRAELLAGTRDLAAFDALWRAACYESSALGLEADNLTDSARRCRLEAARILADAARRAT